MRYPYELNLVGDAKSTLRALIPLLERKSDRSWREKVEKHVAKWWNTVQRRAMTDSDPRSTRMRIFHELSRAAAGQRDRCGRLGLFGELVCPPTEVHCGCARVAVGHVGHDGARACRT